MADKIKKLSDAIRIGASGTKQCFGKYSTAPGETCAIGAAKLAVLGDPHGSDGEFSERIPLDSVVFHPFTRKWRNVGAVVVSLNDDHEWSREKIADWLEATGL